MADTLYFVWDSGGDRWTAQSLKQASPLLGEDCFWRFARRECLIVKRIYAKGATVVLSLWLYRHLLRVFDIF